MSSLSQDAISQCQTMFGVTPKAQQLEVVECIGRGQDVILIAGCGWGKTLVYFLPLVLWQDRIVLIISPLKALMKEQCQKLQDLGISSISLDGDTVNGPFPLVLDRLAAGTYRAVFMTPELIVGSKRVKDLWDRDGWNQRLLAVVVDEAHCISTWGKEFRTAYGDIGDLRSKVLARVAFVAVSATLPCQALKDVKEVLRFREGHVHIVNVGNDRPNIKLEVCQMKNSEGLNILNFLCDFKKTIVYCQTIMQSIKATAHLRVLVDPADASKIAPYHALFSSRYKEKVMEEFNRDRIRLLFATEAVGMGCDLDNVVRVVQFKLPSTILSLVQRLGRAARDPLLQGFGILIVPPVQTIDDPDLQRYIETKGCRRRILDEVFGNSSTPNNPNCCDNCHPSWEEYRPTSVDVSTKPGPTPGARATRRTAEQKAAAKEKILRWRSTVFDRDFRPLSRFYHKGHVMTDALVDKLSNKFANVTKWEDIPSIITWTPLKQSIAEELANELVGLNQQIESQRQGEQAGRVQDGASSSQDAQAVQRMHPAPKRVSSFVLLNANNFTNKRTRK